MSEPELEFEIDEFGCIRYRVTNEGALLSKDEKEFIIDYVTRMQVENAKLRELCEDMLSCIEIQIAFDRTPKKRMYKEFAGRARELGIEVDE